MVIQLVEFMKTLEAICLKP